MVVGHEKGADTDDRVRHNFGMARPEGYRKAVRLMRLAERFHLPVLTFVDTPGAYPGIDAEERGQAEAIARAIEACLSLGVPIVATIIGEGGSGGAIALAAADRILMLEHSIYSVISPEGCASILWRRSRDGRRAVSTKVSTGKWNRSARRIRRTACDSLRLAAEIVPYTIVGVGPLLLAHYHDRQAAERPRPPTIAQSSAYRRSPASGVKSSISVWACR